MSRRAVVVLAGSLAGAGLLGWILRPSSGRDGLRETGPGQIVLPALAESGVGLADDGPAIDPTTENHPDSVSPTVRSERTPLDAGVPTWDQLRRFVLHMRGGFGGIVLRGLQPIQGAKVEIWRGEEDQPWPEIVDSPLQAWSCTSDAEGRYALLDIESGRFVVRVGLSTGEWQESRHFVFGRQWPTILHCFGRSVIEGHVYDERGDPIPHAALLLSGRPDSLEGRTQTFRFHADGGGAYRMTGLVPGTWWIQVDDDGPILDAGQGWSRFDLGPNEELALDLGQDQPRGRWRGRVTDEDGRTLPAAFRIRLLDEASRVERDFGASEDGRFDLSVPPESYRIVLFLKGYEWVPAERLSMPDADMNADVILPGTQLGVRFLEEGADVTSRIRPRLRAAYRSVPPCLGPGPDGRMIWAGLEPGDYRLEIPGRRDFVSGDPEEFKLEIPSGRTSLELDVPVVWR